MAEQRAAARRFHVLDVFTERALAGNPLAVVLDSEGLDTAAMQAIAREFNLSETVFVFNPVDPVNSARLRIFTPGGELPFAGHPTVGTAALLADLHASEHLRNGLVVALELEAGLIRADVARRPSGALRAVFDLPRLPRRVEVSYDLALVAEVLGLDALDIGFGAHGLCAFDAGVPFTLVPVRGLEAIGRAGVADAARWREAFGRAGREGVFLYTQETVDAAHHIHARMFWPSAGITEDPATGSAVAAFAGVAASVERPEDGVHQIIIEQGFEMGRPSLIALDLDIRGGLLVRAALGGSAVRLSEGKLYV
jgi:trans-2,3-dihydro-3-hydroxyanthranilate isomerase